MTIKQSGLIGFFDILGYQSLLEENEPDLSFEDGGGLDIEEPAGAAEELELSDNEIELAEPQAAAPEEPDIELAARQRNRWLRA